MEGAVKIFRDRRVLSPHYLPMTLPHREEEIAKITKVLTPLLEGVKPRNLFIYGKTGTGKTCTVKFVTEKPLFQVPHIRFIYLNCRTYRTQFRVMEKAVVDLYPTITTAGSSISFLYEKMHQWITAGGMHLVFILDEIDLIQDLDDLIYLLTRSNDELRNGSVTIIGISNKLNLKERLGARSKSSLYEYEMVFSPYNASQLHTILSQRAQEGFEPHSYDDGALQLIAAVSAQESGDARYALNLLERAASIAEERGEKLTVTHVESARRSVDEDVVLTAIISLPDHSQLVLYGLANLTLFGTKHAKLEGYEKRDFFLTGEVYDAYVAVARKLGREVRSARWFRDYLSELENLGLVIMTESGRGQRGRTRLIKLAYPPEKVLKVIETGLKE